MLFSLSLASTVLLATNVLAQYGGGSDYGSGSGSGQSSGASSAYGSSPSSMSTTGAQAASPAQTGAASPSGQVMVHVVKVSNKKGDLTFEPNNLQVPAGDMVQFHFYPKVRDFNHPNVVQSTFDQPCEPINNNNASVNGFFSGFMPVKADATMMPSYTIMVNDTKPIWYYCSQGKHCQQKMVGVINPPAMNKSRTIESFGELASKATANLSPGQSSSGTSSSNSPSSSGSSGSGSYGSSGSGSYGSSGSGASPSSAAAPVASDSTSSGTVTTPLTGTNSSTTVDGAAAPSGSAGGQAPVPFVAGDAASLRSSVFRSSLIDDIINTVNTIIYRAVEAIENGLFSIPPQQLGYSPESDVSSKDAPVADPDHPEAKDEIENGVHQLETLLEATVDKTFDKFEIYTLRNILTVPDKLAPWMRLGHYE
ncbi:MAG: hypothetical protein Q9168_003757, partial [Polycauliona sp. 1 TL-2023]